MRRRADDIDRDRRLADEVVEAIRNSGLNRMAVPAELGGSESSPAEMAAIIETIASVDGSAGWCAAVGSGTNVFAGYVPRHAAEEIWHDPDASNASMFGPFGRAEARPGRGLTLAGRWPFVSNCLHASAIGLGAFVDGGPGASPVPRLFFVSADQATVHDTWDVVGLRGTGSHDVSLDDQPVDLDRSCTLTDRPWAAGTLWRIPLFTVITPPLAAVAVGIAAGSVSELRRLVQEQQHSPRGMLVDDPVAMADVAAGQGALSAARAGLYQAMEETWAVAEAGDVPSVELRARAWNAAQHAVDVAVDVTSTVHRLAGSSAVYRGHRLQRALADVTAARQHILFSHHFRPAIGKALAGVPVNIPPFL